MTEVMVKFHLPLDSASFEGTRLVVQLGNGVHLTTAVPAWIESIASIDLCLLIETTGSPPDASDTEDRQELLSQPDTN